MSYMHRMPPKMDIWPSKKKKSYEIDMGYAFFSFLYPLSHEMILG